MKRNGVISSNEINNGINGNGYQINNENDE